MSILDLKAWFRARKYVRETLKWLPLIPDLISIDAIVRQVASFGRIHYSLACARHLMAKVLV
ncbi:hypothetical protein CCP3SC5AM1_590013 [Gammaproteobacteria bacterium]